MAKRVITVSNGQRNQMTNEKWDDRDNIDFNVIEDDDGDNICSLEERDLCNKGQFSFLKSRPEKDYNPKEEVV